MRIHVAQVAADRETLIVVELPLGATVDAAIRASGLDARAVAGLEERVFAIFGRRVTADTVLADGDRVEITRPLQCDPKAVRRKRASLSASRADGDDAAPRARRSKT